MNKTCKLCARPALPPDRYCQRCDIETLKGIGGWLYLVALQLLVTTVSAMMSFCNAALVVMYAVEEGIESILAYVLLAILFIICIILVAVVALFFRKKRSFPRIYRNLLLSLMVYSLLPGIAHLAFGWELDRHFTPDVITSIVTVCLCLPYLNVSKRVSYTFVK